MRLLTIISFIFLLASCMPYVPFLSYKTEYSEYFDLTDREMQRQFKGFDLSKQYQIYLDGLHMHPPIDFHAYEIAKRGKGAVPFLLEKHKLAKDVSEKFAIAKIFEIMEDKGYYLPTKEEIKIVEMLSK